MTQWLPVPPYTFLWPQRHHNSDKNNEDGGTHRHKFVHSIEFATHLSVEENSHCESSQWKCQVLSIWKKKHKQVDNTKNILHKRLRSSSSDGSISLQDTKNWSQLIGPYLNSPAHRAMYLAASSEECCGNETRKQMTLIISQRWEFGEDRAFDDHVKLVVGINPRPVVCVLGQNTLGEILDAVLEHDAHILHQKDEQQLVAVDTYTTGCTTFGQHFEWLHVINSGDEDVKRDVRLLLDELLT